MKRKIAVLLCILGIVCVAIPATADEILFREIPWGSSIDRVIDTLDIEYMFANGKSYLPYWESINSFLKTGPNYHTGWFGNAYLSDNSIKVAGYPLRQVFVYCAYGLDGDTVLRDKTNSRFYAAQYVFDVLDIDATYEDIKVKLISLYGQCEENVAAKESWSIDTDGRTDYLRVNKDSIWHGDNDTCVILTSSTTTPDDAVDGLYNYLFLSYGKPSFDAELKRIDTAVYNEMLKQENESRSDNVDGL